MFKFNQLLSTIIYCVLIAFVIPSIHSKAKTEKKEKSSKKTKTDTVLNKPISEEQKIQRILTSLKESVEKIKIAKNKKKQAYAERDKAISLETIAKVSEKSIESAKIAALDAEIAAYNLAMDKNNKSWGSYLKTGLKYDPLWEQKSILINKHTQSDEYPTTVNSKTIKTATKPSDREKRILLTYDAYNKGIKAREAEAEFFQTVTDEFITTAKILKNSASLFGIEKATSLIKTFFTNSKKVEKATKFYNEKIQLLKLASSKEQQNFEKRANITKKINSLESKNQNKLDIYNQTVTTINQINQTYKATVYSAKESNDAFKIVWKKAKAEIVLDKKLRVSDQKLKDIEKKLTTTDNPIWNKYFGKWDEYSKKWDEYSQVRDSLVNLYNASNSVEILKDPKYINTINLYESKSNTLTASFKEFHKIWQTISFSEQKEKIEADAEFKNLWLQSKQLLIEVNKAVKEEEILFYKTIELGIKASKAIDKEEAKAQNISQEALKVFKEIKKALEHF